MKNRYKPPKDQEKIADLEGCRSSKRMRKIK